MSVRFPLRPDHPDEVAKMAEVFATVVDGRAALYVSSPLTTGRRLVEWRGSTSTGDASEAEYREAFRREVLEPNRDAAKAFVMSLRKEHVDVVIDPTALPDLEGWTQGDYRSLWGEVLRRYARLVIFRDGWEHSDGCAYEFFVAAHHRIPMAREDLAEMTEEDGRALVRASVDRRLTEGVSAEFALVVIASLQPENAQPKMGL